MDLTFFWTVDMGGVMSAFGFILMVASLTTRFGICGATVIFFSCFWGLYGSLSAFLYFDQYFKGAYYSIEKVGVWLVSMCVLWIISIGMLIKSYDRHMVSRERLRRMRGVKEEKQK